MTVEELISKWGFEIEFEPLEHLEEKFKEVQESVLHIAEAVLAGAATMFGFAKFTANAGEQARLAAQQIGITAEAYQELAYVGKLVHLSTEEVEQGFMRLSRSMLEASRNGKSEVAIAFRKMGISVKDSNGHLIGSDKIMNQLADRFSKMPDGPEKTAKAMELFGRSGARLIPILNKGSKHLADLRQEAHDYGVVMDEEATAKSEEFNEALERAEMALTGVRNTIGIALMPWMTKLLEAYGDWIKQNRKFIAMKVGAIFESVAKFIKISWSFLNSLRASMMGVIDLFGGLERVVKVAAYALAIFAAAQTIAAIGNMVTAVWAMVEAWRALEAAELLADAAAFAIPIAIGLAVVAIGLLIEDLVAFFQGRDSVTALIIDGFKKGFEWAENAILGWADRTSKVLAEWSTGLAQRIMGFFQPVVDVMNWLSKESAKLTPESVGKGVSSFASGAANFLSGGLIGGDASGSTSSQIGFNPSTAPAMGGNGSSLHQQIDAPMTINVGDNVSPGDVGRAAKQGITDALDPHLRAAHRSFGGSGGR